MAMAAGAGGGGADILGVSASLESTGSECGESGYAGDGSSRGMPVTSAIEKRFGVMRLSPR